MVITMREDMVEAVEEAGAEKVLPDVDIVLSLLPLLSNIAD